jgi:hypothetical protein
MADPTSKTPKPERRHKFADGEFFIERGLAKVDRHYARYSITPGYQY